MSDEASIKYIFEGKANLQKNIETVGGMLLLTNMTLEFIPHRLNIQSGSITVPLSSISRTESGWTKIFGLIPIFPNAIIIHTNDQKKYRFTVFKKNKWISKIEMLVEKKRGL